LYAVYDIGWDAKQTRLVDAKNKGIEKTERRASRSNVIKSDAISAVQKRKPVILPTMGYPGSN
jgi:hypothetical protein